jgi:mannosyl-oligosaccharide glucosidase
MMANAQKMVDKYGQESLPDPAITLSLENQVNFGSNLMAFQRLFEGEWSFDVYFEMENSKGLDGKLFHDEIFPIIIIHAIQQQRL